MHKVVNMGNDSGTLIALSLATCAALVLGYCCVSGRRRGGLARLGCLVIRRDPSELTLERTVLEQDEPDFIVNNTQFVELNGRRHRIVHRIHELGSKVPLLVFIHGFGGQVSQWQQQLHYFSQTAHVLAVDLLGCGQSEVVQEWEAYTTSALVEDVKTLLLDRYNYPSTVIVAHSYGCAIATLAAAEPLIQQSLRGLVLISPKAHLNESHEKSRRIVRWMPDPLFELVRMIDRKGGLQSKSVDRFLGQEPRIEIRKSQLRWNLQSRTSVYKRFVCGARFPSPQEYDPIKVGVQLIGGSDDQVTPPKDMDTIRSYLLRTRDEADTTCVPEPYLIPKVGHMPMVIKPELVNAVISKFLIHQCGLETLSSEWQILNKTKGENKWDLKNYEKWSRTANITEGPIGPSLFRAMKVMRQTDAGHCPSAFLAKYPEIGFIIDISNDTPPYRTSDFDHSRVKYVKLRTVSKIPPKREDVNSFIKTADSCWDSCQEQRPDAQIAVHCHYGFNRTGFFICSYLIERLHVSVGDAIAHFAEARPPGIRHAHFIDELYLRYERE